MKISLPALPRRILLAGAGAAAGLLVLPGRAPAQSGKKKLDGVTLHVACFSHTYSEFLRSYLPEFEQATGAKVNYETPAFPIYNQRMDIELSTQSPAHDVINLTNIYSGRWVGAGWTAALDEYLKDPKKTPADFDPSDFISGSTRNFTDSKGGLHAIPWIADAQMAGASRNDLIEQAGFKQPDTFDELPAMLKVLKAKGGPAPYITDNHYGWNFIPWLQAFGGHVFRHAPDDLQPMLDTPEAIHAAEFFSDVLLNYGPDGVLSYTYDQATQALKSGAANYSTYIETFLMQMVEPDSKVAKTCALSMMPAGPAGRFPNVASHGWAIPVASRNKDAAWDFITWAMSKEVLLRMFREKGYSSVTRASIIAEPEFHQKLMVNGFDVAKLYRDTLELAGKGYSIYRTVPPYPPIDREIDVAIQNIVSKQMSAKESMQRAQQNALRALKQAGVKL
ncbi:MAG: extracellular solute-binding protein [Alphaproteobacteria bacterium]|nr:extracellular solute-binding protein [Alphaproteobacteria bacterium]